MCLAVIDFQPERDVPVRVVANRDEFRERPAAPMHYWPSEQIYAGQDLQAGGTWMGADSRQRFALITNIRPGYIGVKGDRSRGELVVDFLSGNDSIESFHHRISNDIASYGGFNLVLGNTQEVFWFSSDHPSGQWLQSGIHALSNDALNTPWPKVRLARTQMRQQGHQLDKGDIQHGILASISTAPDDQLPQTGVPLEWERQLSAQTIVGDQYGTRTRTHLILAHKGGNLTEQQINARGEISAQVSFSL